MALNSEEELSEYGNLKYSEKEGYGLKANDVENCENPMWREGISVSTSNEELMIEKSSYLPLKKKRS